MSVEKRQLEGKIALVTGGGGGIGEAIAACFVAAGARTFIAGRDPGKLKRVGDAIGATALPADVSREDDVAALFRSIAAQAGGLDILVNNAGVTGPIANTEDMDMSAWDDTMAINVRSIVLCTRAAVPMMRARGGGSIINMSSRMGLHGHPMRAAYCASKFAVIGITESTAQEVGRDRIRVNALCPGAISGELMDRVVARRAEVEGRSREDIIRENYTEKAALRRWVDPEEVGDLALFLASDASKAITGESIRVDAGRF